MNKIVFGVIFVIDLSFTAVLFYIGYNIFVGDLAVFGLDGSVNILFGVIALSLASIGLVRSVRGFQQLTGQGSDSTSEDVPEYGYRDKWERENL